MIIRGDSMLEVKNVTKTFGSLVAVDNLSFQVENGEIFGLLGENGAGKTTTFRMILGLLEPDKGTILLDGKQIDYSLTDKIGYVTEERSLLTKMTVKEQILYYGALKGMNSKTILKELDEWLKHFEIESYKEKKIKELSKGNQQKVQFISAVINHPKLLILDEPFTGLDPINVRMMKEAIYHLKKEGTAIIFSSHQMEYIEEFCEKLIILVKGKKILDGYLEDIKKSFGIKKIVIKAKDVDTSKLREIKGVTKVVEKETSLMVSIENIEVVPKVFQFIKKYDVQKFEAVEASLSDIFIEKVGKTNE